MSNPLFFPTLYMLTSLHRLWLRTSSVAAGTLLVSVPAYAQLFGPIPDIGGTGVDIRVTVLRILKNVLMFMALVAVVFVVIAGIRLVVSQGEDAEKDKAKKTIIFVIIGLVIILLAQAIVDFTINQLIAA